MKKGTACILIVLFIISFLSCKTSDNFVEQNRQNIARLMLKNGIPLIIKKNENNRVFSLLIGLKGNVIYTPEGKAGIEGITLQMLTKGSEAYSYEALQRILFEKSSGISAFYGSFDYSAFSLFTLDKYFAELFPLYIDCFLHPAWDEEQFKLVLNDMKIKYQQEMNDPYSRLVTKLHDYFFKAHPYLAYFGGTAESLKNITLQDVKNYYKKTFTPERMYVVAVGNFDEQLLFDQLNGSLGELPLPAEERPEPHVPSFSKLAQSELYLEPFAASQGLAFVRADFPAPDRNHPDYPAVVLASAMLDDLLFELVRIQHGAGYGVWAYAFGFKENYASIVVYKTTVPEKVKRYIDTAIGYMMQGRCVGAKVSASAAGKGGIGAGDDPELSQGKFVPIADALEFYKAQFITSYYGAQATNSSIASQILSSLIYSDDPISYLYFVEKIKAVTERDIVRVIKKYFYEQPKMWMVLSSDDVLEKINKQDYMHFLGEGE
ncbi:MAG: insulinase family protein [Spirochaetales bacterium]|nr:insulinase family protein [Spirochaetales bacterium]